ncbi:hypothetical protein [Gallibacterium genomosp. 3]|uniref:Uncharacterized protein n=1 Tax=Gallibacterium genomosp. 3 TaxID=505345 RepID=A0A1A7PVF8_9PAST|nr:hypothetical protein [Gallibacterium genomosp. 3]OBX06563.1 hypothetical protein QV07_08355 [Gallibacterium genomosp. 3]
MVLGNNVTIRNDIQSSYVLGSRVDVTQSNSVYIGDGSVATILPTTVSDVAEDIFIYEGIKETFYPQNPITKEMETVTDTLFANTEYKTVKTKTTDTKFGADTAFETLPLSDLNELITAGELGQRGITINKKQGAVLDN